MRMAPSRLSTSRALRAAAVVLAVFAAGCREKKQNVVTRPKMLDMSRDELIGRLQINVKRTATLKGRCAVTATDQKQLVPASAEDADRRRKGEPFKCIFNRRTLTGVFAMDRFDPRLPERVRFIAEISGVGPVLELLGLGDFFEVKIRNADTKLGAYRSTLYRGKCEPGAPRAKDQFSMRPQDIINLIVCQELLASAPFYKSFYMETWPDYYVIHVLRGDETWAEGIHSKIWVERQNLTIAIHQLYDVTGTMVAEARFTEYINMTTWPSRDLPAIHVPIPHRIRFVWPLDRVIIDVRFRRGDLYLNRPIRKTVWRRFKAKDCIVKYLTPMPAPKESDLPPVQPRPAPRPATR